MRLRLRLFWVMLLFCGGLAGPAMVVSVPSGQAAAVPSPHIDKASNWGRAPFAIASPKFNCAAFQEAVSGIEGYGIAFLWNTFGHDYNCIRRLLRDPALNLIEVHLINGPCIRNKRCGSYEVLAGYTVASLRRAVNTKDSALRAKIQNAAKALADELLPQLREGVACYINPILETNLSREHSFTVQEWVRPYFKGRCKFVWNPMGSEPGEPIEGADVSEGHGTHPVFVDDRCIANPDGAVIASAEEWSSFFKRYEHCVAAFAWSLDDNCLVDGRPFEDPRQRSCAGTSQFHIMRQGMLMAKSEAQ